MAGCSSSLSHFVLFCLWRCCPKLVRMEHCRPHFSGWKCFLSFFLSLTVFVSNRTGFLGYTSSLAFFFVLYFVVVVSLNKLKIFSCFLLFLCSWHNVLPFSDRGQEMVRPLPTASQWDHTLCCLPGNNNNNNAQPYDIASLVWVVWLRRSRLLDLGGKPLRLRLMRTRESCKEPWMVPFLRGRKFSWPGISLEMTSGLFELYRS